MNYRKEIKLSYFALFLIVIMTAFLGTELYSGTAELYKTGQTGTLILQIIFIIFVYPTYDIEV